MMGNPKRRRPVGILLLSCLHIIGGGLFLWFMGRTLVGALSQLGAPKRSEFSILLVVMLLIAFLEGAAGVGMLLRKKWGWALGSFYCAYGVVRSLCAICRVDKLYGMLDLPPLDLISNWPRFGFVECGTGAIVQGMLYLFLFQERVLEYFGLSGLKKWKAIRIHVAAAFLVILVFNVVEVLERL